MHVCNLYCTDPFPIKRWSEKLEATAQSIANECTLKQSGSAVTLDSISLNKYVVTSSIPDYNSAVSQWFGENENYIYESNTCSNGCERYKKVSDTNIKLSQIERSGVHRWCGRRPHTSDAQRIDVPDFRI